MKHERRQFLSPPPPIKNSVKEKIRTVTLMRWKSVFVHNSPQSVTKWKTGQSHLICTIWRSNQWLRYLFFFWWLKEIGNRTWSNNKILGWLKDVPCTLAFDHMQMSNSEFWNCIKETSPLLLNKCRNLGFDKIE